MCKITATLHLDLAPAMYLQNIVSHDIYILSFICLHFFKEKVFHNPVSMIDLVLIVT